MTAPKPTRPCTPHRQGRYGRPNIVPIAEQIESLERRFVGFLEAQILIAETTLFLAESETGR